MQDEPYVLNYDGPIPASEYYRNRKAGIKARDKARKNGYHVLLHKVQFPEAPTIGSLDGTEARNQARRDNNKLLTRITDRFRRKSRRG